MRKVTGGTMRSNVAMLRIMERSGMALEAFALDRKCSIIHLKTFSTMESSATLFDSSAPFGVICNDSGGANQIIALLQYMGQVPAFVHMDGPAKNLWKQSFPGFTETCSDFSWLKHVSSVITGTSWASHLEHEARVQAQLLGIHSIAVLDHWANYQERFISNGKEVLPDEIWVTDYYARNIARRLFLDTPIVLQPDCYGEREAALVTPLTEATPQVLLYLMEPIRTDWGRGEPGEFQALRFFLERLPFLGLPPNTEIHLRPHPSDAPGKYDAFLNNCEHFPMYRSVGSLSDGLSQCRWVAGCQTYAMTVALRVGRKVFGTLPPWASSCVLPHKGIIHLRETTPV